MRRFERPDLKDRWMAVELDAEAFKAARLNMVDCQVRPSDVTRADLIDAMLWAPREAFLPKPKRAMAYVGEHLELAPQRYELDPRVLAKLINAAEPEAADLALVVGGGYGYAAAILSRLTAAVVSLESDATMSAAAVASLTEMGVDNVMAVEGALEAGCPAHSPYNLIIVNGGVATLDGSALFDQLVDGGRLAAIVMKGAVGRCEVMVKSGGARGGRPVFDATAPVLPGFERVQQFVF